MSSSFAAFPPWCREHVHPTADLHHRRSHGVAFHIVQDGHHHATPRHKSNHAAQATSRSTSALRHAVRVVAGLFQVAVGRAVGSVHHGLASATSEDQHRKGCEPKALHHDGSRPRSSRRDRSREQSQRSLPLGAWAAPAVAVLLAAIHVELERAALRLGAAVGVPHGGLRLGGAAGDRKNERDEQQARAAGVRHRLRARPMTASYHVGRGTRGLLDPSVSVRSGCP